MSVFAFIAADLVAVAILVFALYFPRHRRKDLIVAFLSINVGVMGVTYAMTNADISLGFGLGIFAVLSIIRLRSTEMDHAEIAYYFTAIALGLLGGFPAMSPVISFTLMAVLLAVIAVGDHPALFGRTRQQQMILDRAFTSEDEARVHLARMLSADVHRLTIRKVDLVNDSTVVDVRFSRLRDVAQPVDERMVRQDDALAAPADRPASHRPAYVGAIEGARTAPAASAAEASR